VTNAELARIARVIESLIERRFDRIDKKLNKQQKELRHIMLGADQFKTDLAGFLSAFGDLITAVDNYLANTAPADFTDVDQQVLDAAQQASAELAKLNPPTPAPVAAKAIAKHAKGPKA
jgi:hypothetical protein